MQQMTEWQRNQQTNSNGEFNTSVLKMIDTVGKNFKLKIKTTDTKDLHSIINKLELLDTCRMQYQINNACSFQPNLRHKNMYVFIIKEVIRN